jgi:RNA polymerase sigma-70 factor (ECF subfamily)
VLVEQAQAADRDALDRLLRRHVDRVHAVCRRLTGNDADAADATQEALLAIVRGLPRFDGRSAFGTWAYRVATNACLDELRRRKRRPEPASDRIALLGASPGAPAVDAAAGARVDVDAALLQLPLDYRAAVVLRDLCGLDYAEIAAVIDAPVGTVKSRISRGRAMLADLLEVPEGNSDPTGERQSP